MNKLRKVLWDLISVIGIFGYFYFLIKGDMCKANFMLLISLVSDNRVSIMELQEKDK